MVYVLEDTSKVERLFDGWQETLIYSCLQKVMGKVFVTDLENPVSAFAFVGVFGFFAGAPDEELVKEISIDPSSSKKSGSDAKYVSRSHQKAEMRPKDANSPIKSNE